MRRLIVACVVMSACHAPATRPSLKRGEVASNILRGDYAGSAACAACHEQIAADWQRAPMHNMTRHFPGATVRAPLDGGQFRFKDDEVRFEAHENRRYMRIVSPAYGDHLFKLTKVIGGHHREDFAGVEVAGTQADAPVVGDGRDRVMPATWSFAGAGWRYKGYSVMTRERPGLKPGASWAKSCIFCHNTEPYLSDLLGALAGPGVPPYQGEVVDPLLPEARRWAIDVTDESGLKRALRDEVRFLGSRAGLPDDTHAALAEAVRVTRAHFDTPHLVEVGIGCESCHGGSKEHVAHPAVAPSFEPRSPFLRVRAAVASNRAQQINRACARCHQVLFTRYPWTWEGGTRNGAAGGSHINSGEARDFLLGGCASAMSCVACHDPHAPDNAARMQALDGVAGDRVCQKCHDKYADPAAQKAHTHHAPDGAGGRCFGCHMPKKNMSLDNRLTRYHRVGSPNDPVRVERDRPLECALCHADKTVGQLVASMTAWWGKRYDPLALARLYGSADANPLLVTVKVGKPHEQAAAMATLGGARVRAAAPLIAAQLTHNYPILRYFALDALSAVLGRATPIDLFRHNPRIKADADQWLLEGGFTPESPAGAARPEPDDEPSEAPPGSPPGSK